MAGKLTGVWVRPAGKDHSVWRWAYEDQVQDKPEPALVDDEVGADLRWEATHVNAALWSQEVLAEVRPSTERSLAELRVSPSLAEMTVLCTGPTGSATPRISNRRSTYWDNRPADPTAARLSVTPPPHIEHEKIGPARICEWTTPAFTALTIATLTGVTWNHTDCPDGTNSSNDGDSCGNNLTP